MALAVRVTAAGGGLPRTATKNPPRTSADSDVTPEPEPGSDDITGSPMTASHRFARFTRFPGSPGSPAPRLRRARSDSRVAAVATAGTAGAIRSTNDAFLTDLAAEGIPYDNAKRDVISVAHQMCASP